MNLDGELRKLNDELPKFSVGVQGHIVELRKLNYVALKRNLVR